MDKVEIRCATLPREVLRARQWGGVLELKFMAVAGACVDLDLAGAKKLVKAVQTWIDEQEGGQ